MILLAENLHVIGIVKIKKNGVRKFKKNNFRIRCKVYGCMYWFSVIMWVSHLGIGYYYYHVIWSFKYIEVI